MLARMAAELVRRRPLRRFRLPLPVPGFTMCQAWHEIHRNDPGHRWLREQLAAVASQGGRPRRGPWPATSGEEQ